MTLIPYAVQSLKLSEELVHIHALTTICLLQPLPNSLSRISGRRKIHFNLCHEIPPLPNLSRQTPEGR